MMMTNRWFIFILAVAMMCPSCYATNEDDNERCVNCGRKLKKEVKK